MIGLLVRNRAVRLLVTFFEREDHRVRVAVFNQAFDGVTPPSQIDYSGAVAVFAAAAVDQLLAYGGTGRGQHSLSRLLVTMASLRGRQTDPDYADLPRELDALCALPARDEEQAYLARLLAESERLARRYSPLQGVRKTQPRGQSNALLRDFADDPAIALLRHSSRKQEQQEKPQTREYDDILEAFGEVKRAALLGEPGSGKSTTLRKLAVGLARRAQQDASAPLPLLVALGNWKGAGSLDEYLAQEAPEVGWAALALSRAGRLVLLLDGLNEVPTALWTDKAKEVVRLRDALCAKTDIIVSCRQEDYPALDLGLDTLTLERLTRGRIRSALRQWVTSAGEDAAVADQIYWELAGDPALAGVLAKWQSAGASEEQFWTATKPNDHHAAYLKTSVQDDALWQRHVPNPRSLLKLAENPFMLTMLYFVRAEEGGLPQNRGELFGRFIQQLLGREGLTGEGQAEGERLLRGLTELAWRCREGGTVVARAAVLEALSGEDVLKRALGSTVLEGGEELRFRHQLLQEYFTARALQDRLAHLPAADLWPAERWWERSGWEETAVLLAGMQADDCSAIIRWLAGAQPEVAAQCIAESGARIVDEASLRSALQAAWMPRLTSETRPEARAAVGRALGRLGLDSRKGVGLTSDGLPDIDWVEIPAGEFTYQEGERRKGDGFLIARYPVTHIHFEAFVQAQDGYREDRWWSGLTHPGRTPEPARWTEANSPCEMVSWFEAMAFCAWLGHRFGTPVSLPTEWEWERAARGTRGWAYPWGETYLSGNANINETYGDAGSHNLGRTSAVGIYPAGASPEGVLDLCGNIWEWCLNEYAKPKRIQPSGQESRVLRGGSWNLDPEYARAGYRHYDPPGYRYYYIGFRVVRRVPHR